MLVECAVAFKMAQAYDALEHALGSPRKKKRKMVFEYELNPPTDNDARHFWDSWADEVFMSQNIRTSGGRETIKINRLGQEDASGIRPHISSMMITEAGHGDVTSIHRITNKLWIWANWTHYDMMVLGIVILHAFVEVRYLQLE